MTPPISVQLYSVRAAFAADPGGTLTRLREIGLTEVELYGLLENAAVYREVVAASGLRATSAHAQLVAADDPRPTLDVAAELGVGTVIEPAVPEGWDRATSVHATADRINRIAADAAARGIRIGYHNHWWEFVDLDGRPAFEVFTDALDPAVVLEIDTYWSTVGGADTPAMLRALGDRVEFVHVKDGPIALDMESQVPAGQGAMDIPTMLAAAPQATRVLEFDSYAGDVFEGLRQSLVYVTGIEEPAG